MQFIPGQAETGTGIVIIVTTPFDGYKTGQQPV
jgi:hypothetical protein